MQPSKTRNPKSQIARRGAVMVETVLILPILMVVFVLILYLGWNIRRLEKTTQMDRYVAWKIAMPGSPGPGHSHEDDHANLNEAFFTADNSDTARALSTNHLNLTRPQYDAHELLLTQLTEEDFAYYQDFLDEHPGTVFVRFEAEHEPFSPILARFGLSDTTRNATGFRVRNGDWRFADAIRFAANKQKWEPSAQRRITPNPSLLNVFYAQFDEELAPLVQNENFLAEATQQFYLDYPHYGGPDVTTSYNEVGWWE